MSVKVPTDTRNWHPFCRCPQSKTKKKAGEAKKRLKAAAGKKKDIKKKKSASAKPGKSKKTTKPATGRVKKQKMTKTDDVKKKESGKKVKAVLKKIKEKVRKSKAKKGQVSTEEVHTSHEAHHSPLTRHTVCKNPDSTALPSRSRLNSRANETGAPGESHSGGVKREGK